MQNRLHPHVAIATPATPTPYPTMPTVIKHSYAAKRRAGNIALVIIAILWALSFLGSIPIFSEVVARNLYVGRLSCGPIPTSVISYIYVAFYVFVFGVASFIMIIVFLMCAT